MNEEISVIETIGLVAGFGILLSVLVAWEEWERGRREAERDRKSLRDWNEEDAKRWAEMDAVYCGQADSEYECPKCGVVYFEPGECDFCLDYDEYRGVRLAPKSATSVANKK